MREGRTAKKKEKETTMIVACQNLRIHPKLCHFLPYEVVVSLGLMSSVEVFEREGETVEGETKRKTVTGCDRSPYLSGDNPASCWPGGQEKLPARTSMMHLEQEDPCVH